MDIIEEEEDYSISHLSKARDFLLESRAYQELVERLRAEIILTERDGLIIDDIRGTILDALKDYPKENGYKVSNHKVWFCLEWSPVEFLQRQFPGGSIPRIGDILVFTGSEVDAQGSTCEQYIRQTWGSIGIEVLHGLEIGIGKAQPVESYKSWLADGSCLQITFTPINVRILASGSEPRIADIGEILAWIGAALRESPHPDMMAILTPRITRKLNSCPTFILDAAVDVLTSGRKDGNLNGTCWHYMIRNPVVVKGFPILRRENEERGLEMPLQLMAKLGNAERATVFHGGLVIKGHSTMFVPTRSVKQSVVWHFLFREDETRIPYLEASKLCNGRLSTEEFDASHLEISRNFVGWSSSVHVQTGTSSSDINYEGIKWTGSNYASAGCAFEKVSISAGKIINAGVTFARGIKDTPLYLKRAMAYEQEIHDAGNMYVVLYDMGDRRAWLLDGASALLHLTCTQLSTVWSRKSSLFQLENFHFAHSSNGPSAAASALLDSHNRKLPIFEEVETWKEVTTTSGNAAITSEQVRKEEHKEKTTQWCYQDLVRQTYHLLELMHDYQVKLLTSSVTNLRFTDRDKLEGFAFMDIVDGPSAILPRVAHLKPSGKGWVDFTRSICAITLMARGFRELIKSASNSNTLCRQWQSVPIGKDYLVACVSTLSKICERQGDPDVKPLELARGIFWHQAHLMFESCRCKGRNLDSMCDRVQVLLPPSLGQKRHPKPFGEMNGAVIFGRSKRYTWSWPKRGNPTEGDFNDEEAVGDDEDMMAHDSGIGTSIQSSSNSGTEGDGAESQSANDSSNTTPLIHMQDSSPAIMSGALAQKYQQEISESQSQTGDTDPSDMLTVPSPSPPCTRAMLGSDFPRRALDMRPCQDTAAPSLAAGNQEQPRGLKRAFEKMSGIALSKPSSSKRAPGNDKASELS